jgi:protein-tyrosine kinase
MTDMPTEISESFRRVALFLAEAVRGGEIRSVFFASATAGEGTTTTVLETARHLQDVFGLKPLVIEWRRRKPKLAALLGLDKHRSIERCLSDGVAVSECVQTGKSGVAVIPAAERVGASAASAGALTRLLESARADFDIVLVDAPAVLEEPEAILLARAIPNMVLVVCAGRTSEESLRRVRSDMAAENVRIVGAVLNRHRRFIPGWISRWLIR